MSRGGAVGSSSVSYAEGRGFESLLRNHFLPVSRRVGRGRRTRKTNSLSDQGSMVGVGTHIHRCFVSVAERIKSACCGATDAVRKFHRFRRVIRERPFAPWSMRADAGWSSGSSPGSCPGGRVFDSPFRNQIRRRRRRAGGTPRRPRADRRQRKQERSGSCRRRMQFSRLPFHFARDVQETGR